MGYRIDPSRPTDVELRRVVTEQLDRAAATLRGAGGDDPEAVHDVRKRIKRARSALRLGRGDLGGAVVRQANAELREAALALSATRDADALVEAVDALGAGGAVPDLRDAVAARAERRRAVDVLDRRVLVDAAVRLERASRWVAVVPAQAHGWAALGPGLRREYGRGRAAGRALRGDWDPPAGHEWRKRAKDLWHHQLLLRDLWPDAQRPVRTAAERLAEVLGRERDLGLLAERLAPPADPAAEPELAVTDWTPALERIDGERAELRAEARHLGRLLYADRPACWADRHGAWWRLVTDA